MDTPQNLLQKICRGLLITDTDNLEVSARRQYGASIDPNALLEYLGGKTARLKASAVLTTWRGMTSQARSWESAGFKVTSVYRERVFRQGVFQTLGNADFEICMEATAQTLQNPHADTLILATGDGMLASSIARQIRNRRPYLKVISVAFTNSASRRLLDRNLFDAFVPLSDAVLQPFQDQPGLTA